MVPSPEYSSQTMLNQTWINAKSLCFSSILLLNISLPKDMVLKEQMTIPIKPLPARFWVCSHMHNFIKTGFRSFGKDKCSEKPALDVTLDSLKKKKKTSKRREEKAKDLISVWINKWATFPMAQQSDSIKLSSKPIKCLVHFLWPPTLMCPFYPAFSASMKSTVLSSFHTPGGT